MVYSPDLCRKNPFHTSVSKSVITFFEERSSLQLLAGNGELQRKRRECVSVAGVGERDDEYSTTAERRSALPR